MLTPIKQRKKDVKARGKASGGKRAGRGNKGSGQRSRGANKRILQSGGQNPFRRMHGKIGFARITNTPKKKTLNSVKVLTLFKDKDSLKVSDLIEAGFLKPNWMKKYSMIKLIGPHNKLLKLPKEIDKLITFSKGI